MRKGKQAALAAAIILLSVSVTAQSSIEAASYLARAQTFHNAGDRRNALDNNHLALLMFQEVGNASGVRQSESLLASIESVTSKARRADWYYTIGSDYFFVENPSIDSYEKTKYFARLARELYEEVEDTGGEAKAADLMQQAGKRIVDIQGLERSKANSYYATARTAMLNKDYEYAIENAALALEIFTNISDSANIEQTNALIDSINAEVDNIKRNADTAIRTSKNYYASEDYVEALKHAENARALYGSIKDELGLLESNDMISLVNAKLNLNIEERKELAAILYRQAQDDLVKGKFGDALENAKESRRIYQDLKVEAKTDREEELYRTLIGDCNRLINDVINRGGIDEVRERAELYYRQSQEFYLRKQYREALSYAEKSKSLHQDIENYVGIAAADSLISEITEAIRLEKAFSQNITLARLYIGRADFANARIHTGMARSVGSRMILSGNKTEQADKLLELILAGEEKLENAKGHYDRAHSSFTAADYETAETEVKDAVNLYRQLNHSLGLNQSMTLYEKIKEETGEIKSRKTMLVISVAVVLIIVIILVVNYLNKRREITREKDVMVQKIRAEKKEEETKWRIEEEERTKERVAEKFKEMIEEERTRIGETGAPTQADLSTLAGEAGKQQMPADTVQQTAQKPQPTRPQTQVPAPPAKPPKEAGQTTADKSLESEIKKLEAKLNKEMGGTAKDKSDKNKSDKDKSDKEG